MTDKDAPMRQAILGRRGFLTAGAAALAGQAFGAGQPFFKRHGLPIGIQLYTVGPDAAKDLDGTLKALATTGYRSVESAGFHGRTPVQFRAALDAAGVACPSIYAIISKPRFTAPSWCSSPTT